MGNCQSGAICFTIYVSLGLEGGTRRWDCAAALPLEACFTLTCFNHLTHLPYAIGSTPAAAVGFAYILSLRGPFKRQKASSFFHCSNPYWFLQQDIMGVYFPSAGTLGYAICFGHDMLHHSLARYPSRFLSTACECESILSATTTANASTRHTTSPPRSVTLPLLPL